MKRDCIADGAYWNNSIEFELGAISNSIEISKGPVEKNYAPQYVRDIAFDHIKLLLRRYSRGDPISELGQYFEPMLFYWEESERLGKEVWTPEQQAIRHDWAKNLDYYIDCFWVIGLALALEIPDEQWRRLLILIGSEGEDALLDRVIASREPSRKIGTALCYPKPYEGLLMAIDAAPAKQAMLLKTFVEQWYEGVGRSIKFGRSKQVASYKEPYWYNYHKFEGAYFGYWCLEVVAVVKAFGLNDTLCIAHPNYPGDLLRPGVLTTPNISYLPAKLAASIEAPTQPLNEFKPRTISKWEAFKLAIKGKL